MRSSDGSFFDEPTGEVPAVSYDDARVTITGAEPAGELVDETPVLDPTTLLPHWTDAPTGQVPIVVAREAAQSDDPWAQIPAPAWREGEADWVAHEEQFDAALLAGEVRDDNVRPWEFASETVEDEDEDEVLLEEPPRPEPVRASRTRHTISTNPLAGRAVRQRQSSSSNVARATLTGVLLAVVVFGFFLAGTVPLSALILVVLGLASAEAYAGFRSVGAHPASVLGIAAVLTLGVGVYNKGLVAVGAIGVLLIVVGFVWYLASPGTVDVLDGLGATFFVYAWVGVFGSYALLLISPRSFPHHHGMAYLFGAMVLVICNDSGALFIGRWIGHQPLSARLSPNKTREGTLGGTFVTLVGGAIILPLVSPWTLTHGLEAALAISIVAPLGDLFESMIKRTLGVKDLGRLLPGHGGFLDRVDGLLFALPTMYYFVHVFQLG
ncbi:MAG: phosphatidate cytidylyltransferase [Acidobacteriota bacterium]|nr:phosphatidate cytidylyltransferase [Acidobacteriota bacterium]MDE3044283.1 phosphatidate cytidylyltransferase [Acidobacteriota bacterium]MDE3223348.1 phosphatidate cytidylyltransferase [Acidobacteriota bacterium]